MRNRLLLGVLLLGGCAALPPEISRHVTLQPGGAHLLVTVAGPVDLAQHAQVLARAARGICAESRYTVEGWTVEGEGETVKTTVHGQVLCQGGGS
jgi:hypothetical protein